MNCPRDGSLLTLTGEYQGDLYEYECAACNSTWEAFDDSDGRIHLAETTKQDEPEDAEEG